MNSKAIQLRSRWRRNSRLLRLGARVGLGHAGTSARKVFAGAERKEQLSRSRELKSAQQVADELGNMKGALMKVGQMASYLDDGLPEPMRIALSQLQSNAPPMAVELVHIEIERELGRSISDIFVEFDDEPKIEDLPFIQKDNVDISGEDVTDFDTIYEFLERFEEMWKSGNVYNSRSGGSFKPDIEQIQLALNFLSVSDDLDITGKFDRDTEEAIYNYQKFVNLPETGIADSETLEEMFFNLKIKGFDDEDLSMFLINMGVISNVGSLLNGKVEIVGLGGEARQNAQIMIDYMNKKGITNPYTQVGILCVIGKETGFEPRGEDGHKDTDNSRLRKLFGNRVPSDDDELDALKLDDEKFFNQVYGGMFGNSKTEGYKYRGRGFNQLTFKGNYEFYGNCIGRDLVSDPEVVNNVDIAADVAVAFFTKCKSADQLPEFTNEDDAINYFVDLNAGGTGTGETRGNAFNQLINFKIES